MEDAAKAAGGQGLCRTNVATLQVLTVRTAAAHALQLAALRFDSMSEVSLSDHMSKFCWGQRGGDGLGLPKSLGH